MLLLVAFVRRTVDPHPDLIDVLGQLPVDLADDDDGEQAEREREEYGERQ
jgi:hypothetical protein